MQLPISLYTPKLWWRNTLGTFKRGFTLTFDGMRWANERRLPFLAPLFIIPLCVHIICLPVTLIVFPIVKTIYDLVTRWRTSLSLQRREQIKKTINEAEDQEFDAIKAKIIKFSETNKLRSNSSNLLITHLQEQEASYHRAYQVAEVANKAQVTRIQMEKDKWREIRLPLNKPSYFPAEFLQDYVLGKTAKKEFQALNEAKQTELNQSRIKAQKQILTDYVGDKHNDKNNGKRLLFFFHECVGEKALGESAAPLASDRKPT